MKKFRNLHAAFGMKKVIIALWLSFFVLSATFAHAQQKPRRLPKPADWSESDLYNFVEGIVQIVISDTHEAYGGRIPLVDVYSTISGISSAVKPGLILWLNKKMSTAATDEDWARHDRYNAFYTCISKDDCSELRQLEQEIKDKTEEQNSNSGEDTNGSNASSNGCQGFEGK